MSAPLVASDERCGVRAVGGGRLVEVVEEERHVGAVTGALDAVGAWPAEVEQVHARVRRAAVEERFGVPDVRDAHELVRGDQQEEGSGRVVGTRRAVPVEHEAGVVAEHAAEHLTHRFLVGGPQFG